MMHIRLRCRFGALNPRFVAVIAGKLKKKHYKKKIQKIILTLH
jgi:hypothetical protein